MKRGLLLVRVAHPDNKLSGLPGNLKTSAAEDSGGYHRELCEFL